MGKHSQNSEMGRKKSEAKGMSTPPSVQQVQMPTTVIPPPLPGLLRMQVGHQRHIC